MYSITFSYSCRIELDILDLYKQQILFAAIIVSSAFLESLNEIAVHT